MKDDDIFLAMSKSTSVTPPTVGIVEMLKSMQLAGRGPRDLGSLSVLTILIGFRLYTLTPESQTDFFSQLQRSCI